MAYKTLATVFRDATKDTPHLQIAAEMAQDLNAHLEVLALGTDEIHPGAFFAGAGALALRNGMEEAINEAKNATEAAKSLLASTTAPWDVSGAVTQMGALGQVIAQRVALADLGILPKPYGEDRNEEDVAITEAALFNTRTPVLVLPEGKSAPHKPKRVVVAWNQSSEALAAIRAALPLLQAADSTSIAIIDPPKHQPDQADPGRLLAEVLTRHGISCEVSILAKTMPRISDVIKRHAMDEDADLIVMGAYGHSRMREAVFGGATRNMLEHAEVPVLMAH